MIDLLNRRRPTAELPTIINIVISMVTDEIVVVNVGLGVVFFIVIVRMYQIAAALSFLSVYLKDTDMNPGFYKTRQHFFSVLVHLPCRLTNRLKVIK